MHNQLVAIATLVLASIQQLPIVLLRRHELQLVNMLSTQLEAPRAVVRKLRQLLYECSDIRVLVIGQLSVVPLKERLLQPLIPPLLSHRFVVLGVNFCMR